MTTENENVETVKPTRYLSRKVTAIGFIALILLGNYWVVMTIVGAPMPDWYIPAATAATSLTVAGGIMMLCRWIFSFWTKTRAL